MSRTVDMNTRLIPNGQRDRAVCISRLNSVIILFVGLDKGRSLHKVKVDTPDEMSAHNSDAAASIKKREDQLRRTTRHLLTRVVKCVEVGGGICGRLLLNCGKFFHLNIKLKQNEQ